MPARMTLPGTYVFRFWGFERKDDHARHVAGAGKLVVDSALKLTGKQRANNNPISGNGNKQNQGDYALTGSISVTEAGPPIIAEATMTFTKSSGAGKDMTDVFHVVQSGPASLWLVSILPKSAGKAIEEMALGELIKVDLDSW